MHDNIGTRKEPISKKGENYVNWNTFIISKLRQLALHHFQQTQQIQQVNKSNSKQRPPEYKQQIRSSNFDERNLETIQTSELSPELREKCD